MSSPRNLDIELKLEAEILTAETLAITVNSIFEILLFQRNQIPFVWETYRNFVSKWNDDEYLADGSIANFQLTRQKVLAKQTRDDICKMKKIITKAFQTNNISCIRFLFGSTVFTPKESYTIRIPHVSKNHSYQNHQIPTAVLNETIISLLTCETLYSIFAVNMIPTNIFLELEILDDISVYEWKDEHHQLFSKDVYSLLPSCKDVHINLVQRIPVSNIKNQLHCCKEMSVFADFECLSTNDFQNNDSVNCKNQKTKEISVTKNSSLWEASIVVRGFKDKSLKGACLWRT